MYFLFIIYTMKNIIFTGGGTAGHVTPFFAVAPFLKNELNPIFVGRSNGLEKRMVNGTFEYMSISAPKFYRGIKLSNLAIPFRLVSAVSEAKEVLKRTNAKAVFSKGGYVALPVCLAAFSLNIPVIIHESDFSPGLTTKLTAKKARFVLTSFPSCAKKFKNGVCVGPPIRESLLKQIPASDNSLLKALRQNYDKKSAYKPVILVFGGGSGSKAINEIITKNLNLITTKYDVLHICGDEQMSEKKVKQGYHKVPFVKDMAQAYSAADLVMARCGSNSAWEITARGLPALYIPLKKATRGDQIQNANFFTENGAALKADEDTLSGEELLRKLDFLRNNYASYSLAAKGLFKENGSKRIAEILNDVADESI